MTKEELKSVQTVKQLNELRKPIEGNVVVAMASNNIDEAIKFIQELDFLYMVIPDVNPYNGGMVFNMKWETEKVRLEVELNYLIDRTMYSAYLHVKDKDLKIPMSFNHRVDAENFVRFISTQFNIKRNPDGTMKTVQD